MKMGKEYYERAKLLHLMARCGGKLKAEEAAIVRAAQVNYHWRRVVL